MIKPTAIKNRLRITSERLATDFSELSPKLVQRIFGPFVALLLSACSGQHYENNGQAVDDIQNQSSQSIINGTPARSDTPEAIRTVGIYLARADGAKPLTHICTGTIITKNIILTAGHCIVSEDPSDYRVTFGLMIPTRIQDLSEIQIRKVETISLNSKYKDDEILDPQTPFFDIAVLKLSGSIPEGYEVAELPKENLELAGAQELTIAGFGRVNFGTELIRSTRMMRAEIEVLDWNYSETHFRTSVNLSGTCNGDSGGPAFLKTPTGVAVVGVTSFGESGCGEFNYFTRVPTFRAWIDEAISRLD